MWGREGFSTHWKNLNPLTMPPLLEKSILRSSSDMEGLQAESSSEHLSSGEGHSHSHEMAVLEALKGRWGRGAGSLGAGCGRD